jgi:hypothetical protein
MPLNARDIALVSLILCAGFGASVGVTARSELREQGNQDADDNSVPPAALTACLLHEEWVHAHCARVS